MKTKFKIFLFLISFSLSSCGYQPIYSSKGENFSIGDIKIYGDKDLEKHFEAQVKRFQGKNENTFNLEIYLNSFKNTISKDKKGNPSIYGLSISAKIIFKKDNNPEVTRTFSQNTQYNNKENKFDLKRYENNLEKQLLNEIIEDFIFYIHTMR